jgi:OOP family OmpA-OmpF porin
MKKPIVLILTIIALVSFLTLGAAQAFQLVTREMIEKEIVVETDLIKTADNFIILFDASSSSNEMVPGKSISRIQATKDLLKERVALLPDLGYQAGLYIYTTPSSKYQEVYGMQDFDRDRFAAAIDQLPAEGKGPTMMQKGLSSLRSVVAGLSGRTVVFMFTDGTYNRVRGTNTPLQIAQEIVKDKDVCFYLISSADEQAEKQVVNAVTQINSCSRVIPLAAFLDNPLYTSGALFIVKTTAYERLIPVTAVVGVDFENLLFDFDSSAIRSGHNDQLDMLGDYLQKNPDAYVVAAGFADSQGDEEYNLWLSERRAASVKDYLVNKFSIDMDRIVTLWYGELNPAADNATEEGQQINRRVEIAVGQ